MVFHGKTSINVIFLARALLCIFIMVVGKTSFHVFKINRNRLIFERVFDYIQLYQTDITAQGFLLFFVVGRLPK